MNLYEEAWDAENKRDKENYEKNMECFEALTNEERLELMWKDYVKRHCNDVGLYRILNKY